jgi:Domain of unknown function (DU1801)
MARSSAKTISEYLGSLSPEQRETIAKVRKVVLEHLPKGYRESMNWGVISYEIPLERYPTTYNGQPLAYAALAAQKNYYSLHLMGVYADPRQLKRLEADFKKRGKKLDMGKSCLRFKHADDLPLDLIGEIIAGTPPDDYIAMFEATRPAGKGGAARQKGVKKA